jgi:hypothetical protein
MPKIVSVDRHTWFMDFGSLVWGFISGKVMKGVGGL